MKAKNVSNSHGARSNTRGRRRANARRRIEIRNYYERQMGKILIF